MKVLVILSMLVVIAAAAPSSSDLSLLQAFDFDALFKNDELRTKAFDCLLDKVDCGDIQPVKDAVVLMLRNKCAECNAEQKARYDNILKQVHDKYEPFYNEMLKKVGSN